MIFLRTIGSLMIAGMLLTACGSVREDLGLGRSPPDEFAVIDRPPLSMPPDFGLRPPAPGAARPQDVDPSVSANKALFSEQPASNSNGMSESEKALLRQTGGDKATPDIRTTINNESADVVDVNPHLIDQLLWWKKDNAGTTVDAEAEAERIKAAKDKGEPLNQTATPVIEKDKSGWLGL